MALNANFDVKYVTSGGYEKIQELVAADTIQPGAMVINAPEGATQKKLYLIDDDKTLVDIASDEFIFPSLESANTYISTPGTDAKAGRIISVNENNDVKVYTVIDAEGNGTLSLKEVTSEGGSTGGPIWEEL